jgi:hypothetical protein
MADFVPYSSQSFPKFTTEAACQCNSSETTEQNFMKLGRYIQVSVRNITLECLQITPTKFRGSTFPGNMHNYIWCPYYLSSYMKFCSVVSEELCWQTVWRTDGQDKNNMSPHQSRAAQLLWNYWTEFHESWWVVRTQYVVVHITRKFWSPKFCGSYAPLNLEIFRNFRLKQLVSATPLKQRNRILWNLVGSKDTISIYKI